MSFSYLSLEAGGYDREYVERCVSNDPEAAHRTLQQAESQQHFEDDGLAVDSYAQDASAYGEPYGGYGRGYGGQYGMPDPASLPSPQPDLDANTAQRL